MYTSPAYPRGSLPQTLRWITPLEVLSWGGLPTGTIFLAYLPGDCAIIRKCDCGPNSYCYMQMDTSDCWIKDELLQLFYTIVVDFRTGVISEETFREKLLRLAERYERSFVKKEPNVNEKGIPNDYA